MDNALDALVAAKAVLKKTQFINIEANLSSQPVKSGQLSVTTKYGLKRNRAETSDVLSVVTVDVVGLPKDAKADDLPSFTIKVSVNGVYDWDTAPDPSVFEGDNLSFLLAKPLYILVVSEVHSLARKLGLQGVRLDWALLAPSDARPREKLSAAKKTNITTVIPKAKRSHKKITPA